MARRLAQLAEIPVGILKGVGPKQVERLAEAFGIETVLDLLTHYPRNYIDRGNQLPIEQLVEGDEAMVVGRVRRVSPPIRGRGPVRTTADVADDTGQLVVTFFNQAWRARQLPPGTEVILYGKVTIFRGRRQMTNPLVDLVGDQTGRIIPIYPQSERQRLTSSDQAKWMEEVLERAGDFAEPVPADVLDEHGLVGRTQAFHDIHGPESIGMKEKARTRLVFDELLRVQLALVLRKKAMERDAIGIVHEVPDGGGPLVERFLARLAFPLTRAQERVIDEIGRDLAGVHPMHRLLQGDVGSGKTVVAVCALLVAVQGGYQGALMAPTAVLAEQHFAGIRQLLAGLEVPDADEGSMFSDRPLRAELLTNRTTAAERKRLAVGLESGQVDLLIGTHALIEEGVRFRSLGVVVIDEQHRFGVEQRAALREKNPDGATPDVLVMTATPIPRTAAMTVYGDLDVSVLDDLPPGRTPIDTTWIRTPGGVDEDGQSIVVDPAEVEAAEAPVWEHVRAEVAAGRQAYVVCPLIEESEKLEVRSAQETFERLTAPGGELDGLRVGLLHGRLPPIEKEAVMELFRAGRMDVLVATTVIEVGVDVPNATVMVVLDADRFGIAQLHQLRGRVGRGADRSSCYLVGAAVTDDAEERLSAMVRTTDGFELAEVDLDLRGEGTLMGDRQKGRNDLKLASLRRDRAWVVKAREVAFDLVDVDETLEGYPLLRDEMELFLDEDDRAYLFKS